MPPATRTEPTPPSEQSARVVVVGGGVAGLEALLALSELAPEAELTLVDPTGDFVYKPLAIEEPFSGEPPQRHELLGLTRELGARLICGEVDRVDADGRLVVSGGGTLIPYDFLLVCVGARARRAYSVADSFDIDATHSVDDLIFRAIADRTRALAVVVPPGPSWPLPGYELALLARNRSEQLGHRELRIELFTPEPSPLASFGSKASQRIGDLLRARSITLHPDSLVAEAGRRLIVRPGGEELRAGAVISLPRLEGPRLSGVPHDFAGFIPIDEHARVIGVDRVYAAGDGANFPVKHGGLGAQQAEAAAEHIAMRLGAVVTASPFRPVLRGRLLTGEASVHMRHDLTGGHGEGRLSLDPLWWPPGKVAARRLGAFLAHSEGRAELDLSEGDVEIDAELPREWHEEPMALDPVPPPQLD